MRSPRHRSPERAKSPVTRRSTVLPQAQQLQLQGWTQAPAVAAEESELVNSPRNQGSSVLEPGFDTSDDATFPEHFSDAEKEGLKPIVWRRVTGHLVVPSQHYSRLVKGCLCRSTWFLGALSAVSTKQHLLLKLIVSDAHAEQGLYTFQFFKHGAWRQVVVDNRLPCLELQQRLAFASSSTPQELWPSLAEKAYARLHGGYAATSCGCVADALTDLTGGIVDSISLADGLVSEGTVWLHIMQTLSAGNLVVCVAEQQSAAATGAGVGAAAAGAGCCAEGVAGLLADSPYSILAAKVLPSGLKLLRLHNPRAPEGVWQGAWGPDAPEWGSQEGQAALAADPVMEEGLQDPATFWCSFWDFVQVFSTLHLLTLPSSHWQQATVSSGWAGCSFAATADCVAGPLQQQGSSSPQQPALPDSLQGAEQVSAQERLAAASQQQGQPHQPRQQRPHTRQQCQQVSAECLVWASRPQFRLVTASTCEVVLTLGQQDARLCGTQSPPTNPWQQQHTGALHIGLRVSHARSSGPGLQPKALAAAGFSRPGTSIVSTAGACLGSSSSRAGSRARSSSPRRRPGTALAGASAAAADAEDAAAASSAVWAPELQPAVADTGLSDRRDVVLRFVAEGGKSYCVKPFTRSGGDTGSFVLRAWASGCAVQLQQLPAPYSLSQGGQWRGSSAGGSRAHATWASNPHFVITCAREATALLCLQRPDVCNSLLQQPFEASGCIALTLCQPAGAAPPKAGVPAVVAAKGLVAAAAAATSAGSKVVDATGGGRQMDQVALLVKLQPDTPYVLVPSTAEPGIEVPFELQLLSSHPLGLCELPRQCTIRHAGAWEEGTAGGSNLHSSWLHNPAFLLQLERKATCRITLSRASGSWRRNQPLDEMIGLSALRLPTPQQQQQQQQAAGTQARQSQSQSQQHHHKQPANSLTMLKQQQLQEAAFVPMQTCEVEWELPGCVPLLLVPCTYAPGIKGGFTLSVTTSGCGFSCEPVPGGLAALLAASGTRVTRLTQQ